MSRSRIVWRVVACAAGLAIAGFAFLPICDLHFDCGCRWPGAGGHAHCDIHTGGPPDCPWCDHTAVGYASFALSAVLGLALTLLLPRDSPVWLHGLTTLGATLSGLLVAGIATSTWLGIPVLAGL